MADKYERFVAAYLRLNGYFCVPNFIVHAADDPSRISAGHVGNYTETDILGIRLPYSREITGALKVANHALLVDGAAGKTDVVVVEVKSGKNTLNSVWSGTKANQVNAYIARFVGLHAESEIPAVADALTTTFRFEDASSRIRHVVIADEPNGYYQEKGVSYITFDEAISFIVEVRGQCWIEENIGVASTHQQWDDILIDVFALANKTDESVPERVHAIKSMLAT